MLRSYEYLNIIFCIRTTTKNNNNNNNNNNLFGRLCLPEQVDSREMTENERERERERERNTVMT